jgi:hypothetical protein
MLPFDVVDRAKGSRSKNLFSGAAYVACVECFVLSVVCASFISSTWPAVAQQQQQGAGEQIRRQLADQQGQISELEAAVKELRAQNSFLTDLLKGVVSNQVAVRYDLPAGW